MQFTANTAMLYNFKRQEFFIHNGPSLSEQFFSGIFRSIDIRGGILRKKNYFLTPIPLKQFSVQDVEMRYLAQNK